MPRTIGKKTEWYSVKIPIALVEKIDAVIASGKYDFTSRPDFVIYAVRTLLEKLGYYP